MKQRTASGKSSPFGTSSEIVEVRTDAQEIIRALEKEYQTALTLMKIKDEFRMLNQKNVYVKLRWVPGHSDIYGNDVTDKLAKKATEDRYQTKLAVMNKKLHAFLKKKETTSRTQN